MLVLGLGLGVGSLASCIGSGRERFSPSQLFVLGYQADGSVSVFLERVVIPTSRVGVRVGNRVIGL